MLFHDFNIEQDNTPIVLIDHSGSTNSKFKHAKSVLDIENEKVINDLQKMHINNAYIMYWDDKFILPNQEKISCIDDLDNFKIESASGTYLSQALNNIPKDWLNNKDKQIIDVYIYTDGEISDDSKTISDELKKLLTNNVRIYITTVEPNDNNYLDDDCSAGNAIYKILRKNKMTSRVKKFVSYNQHHFDTPFISLNNPDVQIGFAPFRNQCFEITKINDFIKYIDNLIDDTKDKNELLKLVHELSLTISYLLKGKSVQIQRRIVDLFSELFTETSIYKDVRDMLSKEIDNHAHGKATTFQEYRRNREKVFEVAQMALYDNVKESVSSCPNKKYTSMIMKIDNTDPNYKNDVIIKASVKTITEKIMLSDKTYNNAGYKISNYNVPILPLNINLDHDVYDQCIRQWIRANYAKKFNVNPASDIILYYFLADAMRVFLSDVSTELKSSYKQLTYLMLDRKRFGTDITEYTYLLDHQPAPVSGNDDKITWFLTEAMKHINIQDIQPMSFWYAIILAFNDEHLIKSQKIYCENQDTTDLLEKVKNKISLISEIDCSDIIYEYDYTCYITMEDTSQTGGYILPSHKITKHVSCSPNFVLSKDGYEQLKNFGATTCKCPICGEILNINDFSIINSRTEIENEKMKNINKELPILNEPFYNTKNYEVINITENDYKIDNDQTLYKMNDCNFTTYAYSINSPHIQEPLGTRAIETKTQEDFNESVYNRYPFLKKIDFTNVCLAGGFCRSVLLKQKLKDFDFFIYGENNHYETFLRVLKQSMDAIKEIDPKTKFLIMYKHQFNVYEVVSISDPNNFFKEKYTLDNFKQYDFRSLHKFDKTTIIDPETGKIYKRNFNKKGKVLTNIVCAKNQKLIESTKNKETAKEIEIENGDFSNYFEDGDINGIHMHYRLQFILSKFKNIEDIFNSFDMFPSRVAFDGKTTYFTQKSIQAYKYMINIVNETNYSDLFDHRLSKYFTYGFSIVLPDIDLEKIKNSPILKLNNNVFTINKIDNMCIVVEHNSHILNQLNSLNSLEKKSLDKDGTALYKSTMFCSLISLLRFVKINNVSYKITKHVMIPKHNGWNKFRESKEKIHFINKIKSRIENYDFYKDLRLSK